MKGVEIRVREETDGGPGPVLCEAAFGELELVRQEVGRWGIIGTTGDPCHDLAGQFVLDEGRVYFEIILPGDE